MMAAMAGAGAVGAKMECSERLLADSVILLPAGRIDLSNAEAFREILLKAVAAAKAAVILDLSRIEYISSAGLRSLMIASKAGTQRGVKLGVSAMQPIVKEIFTISRFHLVFACFDTVRDAIGKLDPPALSEITARLKQVPWSRAGRVRDDLLVFYHPETLRHLSALRRYLLQREASGTIDRIDKWLRMVAVNRLTGHSRGFFSVYTMPPNQAVSIQSQIKINARRNQTPPPRDVAALVARKSRQLLRDVDASARERLAACRRRAQLLTQPAADTPAIHSESVDLVVTSPPFLDVVNYAADNWLRCWFCDIDPDMVNITIARQPQAWHDAMREVFAELVRVLRPGKFVAFEVGEVNGGALRLEEVVIPSAVRAGLTPRLVLVNSQQFTKTANCWGVTNNTKGTNTNRIVLLQKG